MFQKKKNTNYYGSTSTTLKAIKQWNEVQDGLKIDLDDPEITLVPNFLG